VVGASSNCDEASRAKDALGLLKLHRVRELLLAVAPNEDLNPILVLALPEGWRRLASDVLALEEELREGLLRAE
jgi:uncharacterized protein YjeT (DUF2065 family)